VGKWVPVCFTLEVEVGHCNLCVKFEFSDLKSMFTKNDYELRLPILLCIFDDIIALVDTLSKTRIFDVLIIILCL